MESTRARVPRKALQLMGPLHQLHLDGHEKLSEQALRIGKGISLSFYGARCAWSSRVMVLVLAPNVRCNKTIGHIYLNYIEQAGYGTWYLYSLRSLSNILQLSPSLS